MSFKREGDDKSQLNILKKRRVADLLSHFIPEDEAALMKNGRFACLMCSSRPVFDSVDMLTVHRRGRKHLEGLKAFYGKKAKLKNEITKRQHENYVKAEDGPQEPSSSAPLLVQTRRLTHHALLKTAPYNSCHRKIRCVFISCAKSRSHITSHRFMFKKAKKCFKGCFVCCSKESGSSKGVGPPAADTQVAEPMTAQRRKELEQYLKLKSDGWLQDWNGQWVKDDNVEFDSDEEEPASLAPLPTSHRED
ncbi:sodium channel modifier 1 [Xenentodon cancila]